MQILPYGDKAVLINFEQGIDPKINAKVHALKTVLEDEFPNEITFQIPAYCSLTIGFDRSKISFEQLKFKIEEVAKNGINFSKKANRLLRIPVCYESPYSLDFQEVMNQTGFSKKEIIEFHISQKFQIYMLGFLPGFGYMGKVSEAFFTKRKSTPRLKVPAGSVGLAGFQTGIYPSESPGGWQIIGRTPVKLFDPLRENPFLFRAGDFVEFYSISVEEFEGDW